MEATRATHEAAASGSPQAEPAEPRPPRALRVQNTDDSATAHSSGSSAGRLEELSGGVRLAWPISGPAAAEQVADGELPLPPSPEPFNVFRGAPEPETGAGAESVPASSSAGATGAGPAATALTPCSAGTPVQRDTAALVASLLADPNTAAIMAAALQAAQQPRSG